MILYKACCLTKYAASEIILTEGKPLVRMICLLTFDRLKLGNSCEKSAVSLLTAFVTSGEYLPHHNKENIPYPLCMLLWSFCKVSPNLYAREWTTRKRTSKLEKGFQEFPPRSTHFVSDISVPASRSSSNKINGLLHYCIPHLALLRRIVVISYLLQY